MNQPLPKSLGSNPAGTNQGAMARRQWLAQAGNGCGSLALAHLLAGSTSGLSFGAEPTATRQPHFAPKAKRVIYLFQSGGPSQLETFDYKPLLNDRFGEALPDSVRQGQRLTGMSANQSSLIMVGSKFGFQQHGAAQAWVSDLLPHTAKIVDDLCIVRSIYTEAINHDPAITFLQTGSQIAGRPSIGAWLNYGLGSDNENLPAFVVLITRGKTDQPLYSRLWGSGFLPSQHQGVQFRSGKDAVLYLNNPPGVSREQRRAALETLAQLQKEREIETHDPELSQRIAQYEMAFRMQASVPEATDLSGETEATFELYGPDSRKPGTFAANCLLARRLAERGVKFIQLYHQGWDQHGGLPGGISTQCRETDQPSAALVADLKQRGLLEDTLVVWGGEFGRTSYSQGRPSPQNYGRDHHPRCFSMWFAGGGIKPATVVGRTCDFGYNIEDRPVHVHDLHATMLHLLGMDHERLTYRFQGRDFRLTDVHGHVIHEMLA
ncbi:DUF1501 domain-containing protein [Planctopirus hydrillae]|nr:DUF1501 domain-containing protein [Planctopirus hydrillae]